MQQRRGKRSKRIQFDYKNISGKTRFKHNIYKRQKEKKGSELRTDSRVI